MERHVIMIIPNLKNSDEILQFVPLPVFRLFFIRIEIDTRHLFNEIQDISQKYDSNKRFQLEGVLCQEMLPILLGISCQR